jgi:hypothetical protein
MSSLFPSLPPSILDLHFILESDSPKMSSLERLLVLVKNLARQEVDEKLKSQVNTIVDKVDNEEEKIKVRRDNYVKR